MRISRQKKKLDLEELPVRWRVIGTRRRKLVDEETLAVSIFNLLPGRGEFGAGLRVGGLSSVDSDCAASRK